MGDWLLAVLNERGQSVRLQRLADQSGKAGGTALDFGALGGLTQQVLSRGAAADIADADDEHLIEHAEFRRCECCDQGQAKLSWARKRFNELSGRIGSLGIFRFGVGRMLGGWIDKVRQLSIVADWHCFLCTQEAARRVSVSFGVIFFERIASGFSGNG